MIPTQKILFVCALEMNENHSRDQFSGSENFQINLASQPNPAEGLTASHVNASYVNSLQNASIYSPSQHYGNPEVYTLTGQFPQPQQTLHLASVNTIVDSPIAQNNFVVNSLTQPINPISFFYQPPNDLCNYRINCNEISFDTVIQLLNEPNINRNQSNEYIFFHQQQCKIYQIACEIVSPSLIINFLNRTVYGIEFEQNVVQEQLSFTFEQKGNLKFYLTRYLSHYYD